MTIAIERTPCNVCEKARAILRSGGYLQEFCHRHIETHRQDLNKRFDEFQMNTDLARQILIDMTNSRRSEAIDISAY